MTLPLLFSIYRRLRPFAYEREYLRRLLCQFLNSSISLQHLCAEFAYYRMGGHDWIPLTFVGLHSELDAIPDLTHYHLWNAEALAKELREAEPWIRHYRQMAQEEAQRALEQQFAGIACQ